MIKDFNHLMMKMLRADLTRYTRMARFGLSRSDDKENTRGAPSYQHSQSDGSTEDNDLTLPGFLRFVEIPQLTIVASDVKF